MELWGTITAFAISFAMCLVTHLIMKAVDAKNKG